MPSNTGSKFDDRRNASLAAKQALLERFKARPAADDPEFLAKQAELKAISDAREARAAERRAEKAAEEAARKAAEAAKRAAAAAAEEERQRLARQAAFQNEERLRAQKAARDARYAARKARK